MNSRLLARRRVSGFGFLSLVAAGALLSAGRGSTVRAEINLFGGAPPPPAAEQLAAQPARLVRIESPDNAQTFTDSTTVRHLLRWDARAQALRVVMVFANSGSQGQGSNRVEEQFTFRLPGVSLDPETGVFTVRGPRGLAVPVAKRVRGGGGFSTQNAVEPTVGARVFVSIVEGLVKVTVTADPAGSAVTDRQPTHWVIDSPVSAL
jgi:hypothetical protein